MLNTCSVSCLGAALIAKKHKLNCVISCPPSGSLSDNSAPELSFFKKKKNRATIQLDAQGKRQLSQPHDEMDVIGRRFLLARPEPSRSARCGYDWRPCGSRLISSSPRTSRTRLGSRRHHFFDGKKRKSVHHRKALSLHDAPSQSCHGASSSMKKRSSLAFPRTCKNLLPRPRATLLFSLLLS